MEKVSQALQALKDMQSKAEEIKQRELQSCEENLKDMSQSVETTFEADIVNMGQAARKVIEERYEAYTQRQLEQFQLAEARLEKSLKDMDTMLVAHQRKTMMFLKSSLVPGLGIIGMSLGVAMMIVAWSLVFIRPQTEALQQKNSELQQQVDDLQTKIDQQQPKTKKRK